MRFLAGSLLLVGCNDGETVEQTTTTVEPPQPTTTTTTLAADSPVLPSLDLYDVSDLVKEARNGGLQSPRNGSA